MNIDKLNLNAKREILAKVGKFLLEVSENEEDEDVELTLELLVEYYLDPLSSEDYFGPEGWEKLFDI